MFTKAKVRIHTTNGEENGVSQSLPEVKIISTGYPSIIGVWGLCATFSVVSVMIRNSLHYKAVYFEVVDAAKRNAS